MRGVKVNPVLDRPYVNWAVRQAAALAAIAAPTARSPFAHRISLLANFLAGSVYLQVQVRHGIVRSEFMLVFCLRLAGD